MKIGTNKIRFVKPVVSKPSTPIVSGIARKPILLAVEIAREQSGRLNNYDWFKPVHIVSRLFGLLPFTINVGTDGNIENVKVGKIDAIWFAGFIAINLMLLYLFVNPSSSGREIHTDSAILYISDLLFGISGTIIVFISTALDMLNRNRLAKILQSFITLDKNVRQRNIELV